MSLKLPIHLALVVILIPTSVMAGSFPPLFELAALFPAAGGDGSDGTVFKGAEADEFSGISVSGIGDINNDGLDDLIIGAPATFSLVEKTGRSFVVYGRSTGFAGSFELASLLTAAGGDGSAGFVINGVDVRDTAGESVSGAGDINGDGIDDLIVGASFADPNGKSAAGESYVVFGREDGFPAQFDLASLLPLSGGDGSMGFVINGVSPGEFSGRSVSGAGDINGDGIDDLIIGAFGASPYGRSRAGRSYVVFGRSTGFPASLELVTLLPAAGGDGSEGFVIAGVSMDEISGASVSSAGDMNGDGIDDLIIGATDAAPNGKVDAGRAYVVFGRNTGFPSLFDLTSLFPFAGGDGSQGFVIKGRADYDNTGVSVSSAGDINGDGIGDIVIGASNTSRITTGGVGSSYVMFGRTTGFAATFELASLLPQTGGDGSRGFVLSGFENREYSGFSVDNAGDVNNDGIDDLLIGAYNGSANGYTSAGRSYVYYGRTTAFPASFNLARLFPSGGGNGSEGFVLKGVEQEDDAGWSVSGAGDIDGDGIDDLIISAPFSDANDNSTSGESYLVLGTGS